MQSATQQGSPLQSLRVAQRYVKVGAIVYFVIVPVVCSVAISHVWAVSNTDVYFFLPYISDSGGDPPQSAVFGLGLTIGSIAGIVTFALRYITVMDISKARNMPQYVYLLNYFNFLAGIGIFFGLLLVAMNPTGHLRRDGTWLNPIFYPHVFGASILFVSGLSYMLADSLLTLCLLDQYHNHFVFKARLTIFLLDAVACAVTAVKYPKDFLTMKPHPSSPREYPEGTLISIIAEWMMLATFMGYFYTMKSELDAMVVVIGIQKRRSSLVADEVEVASQPPLFASANDPTPQIILQQPSALHPQRDVTNAMVAGKDVKESLPLLPNARPAQPVLIVGSSRLLPEPSSQKAMDHEGGGGPPGAISAKTSRLEPEQTQSTITERKTDSRYSPSLATSSTNTTGTTTTLTRTKSGRSSGLRRAVSSSGASPSFKRGSPGRYVRPTSGSTQDRPMQSELTLLKQAGERPMRASSRTASGRSTPQGRLISSSHSQVSAK